MKQICLVILPRCPRPVSFGIVYYCAPRIAVGELTERGGHTRFRFQFLEEIYETSEKFMLKSKGDFLIST